MEIVTPSPAPSAARTTTRTTLFAARSASPQRARTGASSARTLGHQLERDRLEQRALRVRQVIRALRDRAEARDTSGGAPRPLRAAIEDFGRELAELERRLHPHGTAGATGR